MTNPKGVDIPSDNVEDLALDGQYPRVSFNNGTHYPLKKLSRSQNYFADQSSSTRSDLQAKQLFKPELYQLTFDIHSNDQFDDDDEDDDEGDSGMVSGNGTMNSKDITDQSTTTCSQTTTAQHSPLLSVYQKTCCIIT